MDRKRFLVLIVGLFTAALLSAQEALQVKKVRVDSTIMILNSMTVEDYMALELPPLDTLYYNAFCMSNAVKYYDNEVEYYRCAITTEQLKPLEWIRLVTSASYGNTDLVASMQNASSYPIWIGSSSKQRSFYFNAGVTLSIPLSDVFNTANKVRQARAKLSQTEARRDSELDNIKKEIITLYCEIISGINTLKSASERLVLAQAQYDFAEKDFVNNKITAEVLYRSKSYETAAVQDYERVKKEVNQALLSLEVISCTKIIKIATPSTSQPQDEEESVSEDGKNEKKEKKGKKVKKEEE